MLNRNGENLLPWKYLWDKVFSISLLSIKNSFYLFVLRLDVPY